MQGVGDEPVCYYLSAMIVSCGKLLGACVGIGFLVASTGVSAATHEPLQKGSASWYRYRGCLCAASPDYPKGTKLRVTRAGSSKSVIVTVNDFGPNRKRFPKRAIDLDATAFRKLGRLSEGLIEVRVEPVIAPAVSHLP